MQPKLAIIGAGKMGGAIARGVFQAGTYENQEVLVVDVDRERQAQFSALGANTASDVGAAGSADVVIIAVKPGVVGSVLEQLQSGLSPSTCVISVAAGISLSRLEAQLPGQPVIRVMPNLPALVGEGITAVAPGRYADPSGEPAVQLFSAIGETLVVPEAYFPVVTGLSGSGPAYVCLFIEALIEGAVAEGLPRQTATRLAISTVKGTAALLGRQDESPAAVRAGVTSPGGTTAAGLRRLEAGAVRYHLMEAVRAAAEKSRKLGRAAKKNDEVNR